MKVIIAIVTLIIVVGVGWFVWDIAQPPAASSNTSVATSTPVQAANPSTSSGQATINSTTNSSQPMPTNVTSATLHTNLGDITIKFYPDQAPQTVANFIKLAQAGFYDSTKFHRVIAGFMDQGGDPLTKDDSKQAAWGTGGPGYTIPDEFGTKYTNTAGSVAMANTGAPNSSGSQFFINAVDNHFLDGKYSVFGQVTSGMDVVTKINNTPVDAQDRPLTPVVLKSITLQ
jgi:cyclophilin family peptidyl-prolyl cis-trans isomerase